MCRHSCFARLRRSRANRHESASPLTTFSFVPGHRSPRSPPRPAGAEPRARILRDVKSTTDDIERSFLIAERAMELMKAYGSSAAPRSYEVWYTYVGGQKPLMNDAIRRPTVTSSRPRRQAPR